MRSYCPEVVAGRYQDYQILRADGARLVQQYKYWEGRVSTENGDDLLVLHWLKSTHSNVKSAIKEQTYKAEDAAANKEVEQSKEQSSGEDSEENLIE